MEQSPRLSLSYVAPSQAQKHVTVNETFRRLDALVQMTVRSQTISVQPGAPAEGEGYIVPPGATGAAWETFSAANAAFFQDGAWTEIAAVEGMSAFVADEGVVVVFDGAAWSALSGAAGETAAQFGVNADADAVNRLSVKSDAVLFSHDDVTPGTGDARVKVNKDSAADTASHLFQTGFSGRAEFGLTGDDDFHIKVSPDNFTTVHEALVIDKDTGAATMMDIEFAGDDSPLDVTATRYQGNSGSAGVSFHKARGTKAAASNPVVNDRLGQFAFRGYGGGSGGPGGQPFYNGAFIRCKTTAAAPSATDMRAEFAFMTAGAGSVSPSNRFFLSDEGFWADGATGGGKGDGTINAKAVYDDNTLLSCYVFDQALDGVADATKWDAKAPGRHFAMRKFAARAGTEYDPLTLDGYARHWREKRHLTSMPNEATFDPDKGMPAGAWVQRLVETVEIQAVLIETLNARLKKLEGRG